MKRNIYIVILIVVGGVLIFVKEQKQIQKMRSFLFVNIESLAGGESGGADTKACGSNYSSKIEYQNCRRGGELVSSPMRVVDKYSCDGAGKGSCKEGEVYTYYSCDGYLDSLDYTTTKYCF